MTWGFWLYFPSEGRYVADFYRPSKNITSTGCEPVTLGSSGNTTNHYTTKVTLGGLNGLI
jgi:hypothetical protein